MQEAASHEPPRTAARSATIEPDELQNLRTAFGLMDRDRDGQVTASELQQMLASLGINVRAELITELLAQASHSGASLVNESEFLQWVSHIEAVTAEHRGSSPDEDSPAEPSAGSSRLPHQSSTSEEDDANQDLMAAFRVFDRDSNGFITMDELRSAMEMIGEAVTEHELREMLAMADVDRDGRINYEEFAKLLS